MGALTVLLALLSLAVETKDPQGEVVAVNLFSLFIRGLGGFGGRGSSTAVEVCRAQGWHRPRGRYAPTHLPLFRRLTSFVFGSFWRSVALGLLVSARTGTGGDAGGCT
jgi:hypothetical protein